MIGRILTATVFLGLLTVGAGSALGDMDHRPGDNGYMPWHGEGFGPVYPAGASTGPQQQAQVYDISPAMGQAAFAEAEFDNRWAGLQVLLERARNWIQLHFLKDARRESIGRRETSHGDGKQAGHIGIDLPQRDSRLQSGDTREAEVPQLRLAAVKLHR